MSLDANSIRLISNAAGVANSAYLPSTKAAVKQKRDNRKTVIVPLFCRCRSPLSGSSRYDYERETSKPETPQKNFKKSEIGSPSSVAFTQTSLGRNALSKLPDLIAFTSGSSCCPTVPASSKKPPNTARQQAAELPFRSRLAANPGWPERSRGSSPSPARQRRPVPTRRWCGPRRKCGW